MKKNLLFMMTAMLLTFGMFSACSSDDDEGIVVNTTSDSPKDENNTEPPQINDIHEMVNNIMSVKFPYKKMEVEDMPSWLVEEINQSKELSKVIPVFNWYYQFNWKESTYYLIYTNYSINVLDLLFNSQGEKIEISPELYDNCLAYSSDWYFIYTVQSE